MDIIVSLLVAVHVIVCLLLVVIVLMQRPKQEGLGAAFGGGVTDQMFGAQTTDVLQKGTVWLSVMFFAITMVLAILVSKQNNAGSALGKSLGTSEMSAGVEEAGGLPVLPKGEPSLVAPVVAGDATPAGDNAAQAKPAGETVTAPTTAPESGAAAVKVEKPAKKEEAKPAAEAKKTESAPAAPATPPAEKLKDAPAGEEAKAGEGTSN